MTNIEQAMAALNLPKDKPGDKPAKPASKPAPKAPAKPAKLPIPPRKAEASEDNDPDAIPACLRVTPEEQKARAARTAPAKPVKLTIAPPARTGDPVQAQAANQRRKLDADAKAKPVKAKPKPVLDHPKPAPAPAKATEKPVEAKKAAAPTPATPKAKKPAKATPKASAYDWDAATIAAKSGKIPPLPPWLSYGPHIADFRELATKGDVAGIKTYSERFTVNPANSGQVKMLRFRDLCLLAIKTAAKK